MNFFEQQDSARKYTGRLVLLFGLAVLAIIAALYLTAIAALNGIALADEHAPQHLQWEWWRPDALVMVSIVVASTIGLGSLLKILSLRSGGASVAMSLGGRLIDPSTTDPKEKRLINIVEEMAIASGVPVPLVFVMDGERGINAFAAGYTMNDAAVAVTRGTLDTLNRDELQGVVAHEFSHILNGDMRLNIRLIGILHGILVIGSTGVWLLKSAAHTGGGRRLGNNRDAGGIVLAIVLLGAILAAIGYIGVFFGRLIKSAVSRQREFLADASAVQFTRNPLGIAGALKKIGGYGSGSAVDARGADELSHLFFSKAVSLKMFDAMMSTHPPLVDRIQRIDPGFDGNFEPVQADAAEPVSPYAQPQPQYSGPVAGVAMGMAAGPQGPAGPHGAQRSPATVAINPATVVNQVGAPTEAHVGYSRGLLSGMPDVLKRAAHEPFGAVALVYALLLDADQPEARAHQVQLLKAQSHPGLVGEAQRLFPYLGQLDPRARLPIVEILAPALRQLSPAQHDAFVGDIRTLVEADRQVSIFEFALQKILFRRLVSGYGSSRRSVVQFHSLNPLRHDVVGLVSALTYVGHTTIDDVNRAYTHGMGRVPMILRHAPSPLPPEQCTFDAVDRALGRLDQASPGIKARVLDACAHAVLADGEVTIQEAELLRAIADALECPLPPFLEAA